jgi:hypothetical protein
MASKKSVTLTNDSIAAEPETFEQTARRMLECALALYDEKRSLATREIREAVRNVVAQAKARGVHAERMLIELKHTWYSAEAAAYEKSDVISALVTMCIREFYDTGWSQNDG